MFGDGRVSNSCCPTIHLSDIFRLAVLARYGGWYSDLDTVTVAASTQLANTVGDAGTGFVANGNLIFSAGHSFLASLLQRAEARFTGQGSTPQTPHNETPGCFCPILQLKYWGLRQDLFGITSACFVF